MKLRRVDLNNANEEPHRRDGGEECAQEEDELSDVSGLRVVTDGANCGSIRLVLVVQDYSRQEENGQNIVSNSLNFWRFIV